MNFNGDDQNFCAKFLFGLDNFQSSISMAKQQQWFLQKTAEEWLANSGQALTVAGWNNHLFLLCKKQKQVNKGWLLT